MPSNQITSLSTIVESILKLNDEAWNAVADEIITILQRVMRDPIRESELQIIRRDLLPGQVSIRFNEEETRFLFKFAIKTARHYCT